MSADNGIYILQSGTDHVQFRIVHAQAIENIYYDSNYPVSNPSVNKEALIEYFADSVVYTDEDEAWKAARGLYDQVMFGEDGWPGIIEYGLSKIVMKAEFPK